MAELDKVIRGLRDIDIFIAGRLGHEKAKNFLRTIDETIMLLKEQETVVRCKDCKNLSSPANGVPFCKHIKKFVNADWFCADGMVK